MGLDEKDLYSDSGQIVVDMKKSTSTSSLDMSIPNEFDEPKKTILYRISYTDNECRNLEEMLRNNGQEDLDAKFKTEVNTKNKITHNDVANYFLAFANEIGELITNLKLQKLVYYAQAWYLANYLKPLFDSDFEAWVHGPAIPELYHKYKSFAYRPIESDVKLREVKKTFDKDTLKFLDEVISVYMPYGAYQLELMVHREVPWSDAREGYTPIERCNIIIKKETMREFYAKRLKED